MSSRRLRSRATCGAIAGLFALSLAFTFPPRAEATDDFADAATSTVTYTKTTLSSAYPCASLTGRQLDSSTKVTSATLVAAANYVPAYCDIRATVAPSNLIDVAMPIAWNQRLYGLGNGGCGGDLSDNFPERNLGLQNGFAVVATDTGHEASGNDCSWAANHPQLVVDFAYAGVHQAAVEAKKLLQIFYARGPAYAYFNDCSDGGHDGLEETQRYPNDYDGVVAGSPALGAQTIIAGASIIDALNKLPSSDAFTPAKVNYVASAVYAKCDALDGVADGVITDPRLCGSAFNPNSDLRKCGAVNGSSCLTADELAAYEKGLAPIVSAGKPYSPGWPLGDEIFYEGYFLGSSQATLAIDQTYMTYLFPYPKTDPKEYGVASFNFNTGPSAVMSFRTMFDVLDLNLSPFVAHGGKLLMYHGWADPLITPYGTVALYEDESRMYGSALANSDRLFMVPGMAHCSGGPGADQFDPMTAIINWAEIGAAPADILSRHFAPNGKLTFTRKLCAYPDIAAYEGGSKTSWTSFTCVAGPTGVPGTSSSGDGLQLP